MQLTLASRREIHSPASNAVRVTQDAPPSTLGGGDLWPYPLLSAKTGSSQGLQNITLVSYV